MTTPTAKTVRVYPEPDAGVQETSDPTVQDLLGDVIQLLVEIKELLIAMQE